jgi:hypothetical protein
VGQAGAGLIGMALIIVGVIVINVFSKSEGPAVTDEALLPRADMLNSKVRFCQVPVILF